MTYNALKSTMGKEFAIIVELYMDSCANVYGVAPCTAAVGVTGTQKCFNTLKNCQDTSNYNRGAGGTKIYRFSSTKIDSVQQAGDTPTFPTVRSIDTAPTLLTPGKGLGIRSSVTIQLDDHPWTDVGTDPYLRERTYSPDDRGSFWGKFLARNPNYEKRRIDILTGYLNADGSYDVANFRRRTYLLNKISGPDTDGRVTIEAKDPLKGADVDKSQWPVASQAALVAGITTGDTTFSIGDPNGYVAANYALGQTYIRIDDEIMRLTIAPVDTGGGFFDITVSRSDAPAVYDNSLNAQPEHSLGALVQPCWYFEDERIDFIIYTLLFDGAHIPASYLPTGTWGTAVLSGGLDNYLFTALISQPVGIQDLLTEISQHGILIWWDERQQVVLLKSLIATSFVLTPFNEDTNVVKGSISVTRDVSNRISQAWLFFGHRFPTLEMDKLVSFSSLEIKIDTDAESPEEYDQSKVYQVFSRWLPTAKRSTASEIASRQVSSYRDSKIVVSMSLDAKDDSSWTGDTVGLKTGLIQDETGAAQTLNYIILEVDEVVGDTGVIYKYRLQAESTLRRTGVITPNDDADGIVFGGDPVVFDGDPLGSGSGTFPDYSAASALQKAHYAFIAPNSGVFADGTPAYQIQ